MNVLVIDVGGTNIKILATGQTERRKFPSGRAMTPDQMVAGVKQTAQDWAYDVVSMGYPGPVLAGKPLAEPFNLGPGWVGFDFEKAFGCHVKVVNDAAMQALGSYDRDMLQPMELGHLPYRKATFEDYIGARGLERFGKKKWRHYVADVVERLQKALEPDYIVLGGGNLRKLKELPAGCRAGANANAFIGGFRLWDPAQTRSVTAIPADGAAGDKSASAARDGS